MLLTNQKRDWPLHKVECKSLISIRPHSPSDTMRLVVRVMQRKKIKLKKEDLFTGREIDFLCSSECMALRRLCR